MIHVVFEISVKLRRHPWRGRTIPTADDDPVWDRLAEDPRQADSRLESLDLVHALRQAVERELTPRQREVFKAVNVKYHATKRLKPDQSPSESMKIGYASCSGLSIILVDACRAVGVPARVVGTPLRRGNCCERKGGEVAGFTLGPSERRTCEGLRDARAAARQPSAVRPR